MTELETQIWNTVHNWCDAQSNEIPDQNRRYLMDEMKALVLSHVSKSLPIKKYEIDFDGDKLTFADQHYSCTSPDPDDMCKNCTCWKATRKNCS